METRPHAVERGPVADSEVVAGLRAGDEAVFAALVREQGSSMLRMARLHVSSLAVAEEVVQDAWIAALRGIASFEGRSTLKTWLLRIVINTAKTRGERERRTVPFSALARDEAEGDEPAVDPDRFHADGRWAGHWSSPPSEWAHSPERRLLDSETLGVVERAVATLTPAQAAVLRMRDIVGFEPAEVCNVLEISESNQRVLLHRARSRVRAALEQYLAEVDP